jgi:hypothetical protein
VSAQSSGLMDDGMLGLLDAWIDGWLKGWKFFQQRM